MAKTFSGRRVVDVLVRKYGFRIAGQKGSHIKLKKKTPRGKLITVVPLHRELATGTLRGVLNLVKIDYKKFLKVTR